MKNFIQIYSSVEHISYEVGGTTSQNIKLTEGPHCTLSNYQHCTRNTFFPVYEYNLTASVV
jgi:hypothetical protein